MAASAVCANSQPRGPGASQSSNSNRVIKGEVASAADSSAIYSAEIRSLGGQTLARSDRLGRFAVRVATGDTLIVRALGFRSKQVITSGNESKSELSIALAPLPTVLQTYTTTVGQRVIRASEATTVTTVLSREDIKAAAAISANQLLRQIPGLQELSAPPSKTSIAIRGFDDSRVLVLVDGEPAAGTLIENRDIGRLSTVAAERIEVTKGPSSVEFGSDALGGVINLVTAAPSKQFAADGLFRQGGLGRRESTVGVSQTIGRFGYRANGGWRQTDRVTAVDAEGSAFERVYDVRTSFRYAVSERLALRTDVQGAQERQRWPVGGGYNGFIDNQSGQGFVEAELHALGGNLRARAFGQRYNYQYRQSQKLLPIAGSGDSLEQRERLQRYLLAYSRAAGRHIMDVGAQFSRRDLISPGKVEGDSANDDVREVFARDAWSVGPALATFGVRYTNSSLWGDAVNPSVGLAWQIAPGVRLRSNVARGFRAPSFKEIRYTFSNPGAGYTVIGNANLEPESSWSSSIGATYSPAAHVSIDVEGYRNSVSNLIDTRFEGTNAVGFIVYQNVNVARAHTNGIETSVQYEHGPFNATVGYDYLRARDDETATPLSRRATHTARVRVARSWSLLSGALSDISARYTGASPLVGTVNNAPAIVGHQAELLSIDGQLRVNVARSAELSAGVNNLLDMRPLLFSPAYQRQFYVAAQLRWGKSE